LLPEIEGRIAQDGLAEFVHLRGIQPLEAMPAAIAAADVGVVPMRRDAFTDCVLPTKLLEYVTLGLPVIAVRTATTTDYFDESMVLLHTPGDAVDLAQKLLAVYRDPAAAQARAEHAQQFTVAHNWQDESKVYLQLIQQYIGA
jgi:glycosyltransferase involved in cell wall biosynthesis